MSPQEPCHQHAPPVLVTGASGTIDCRVITQLLAAGSSVRAGDVAPFAMPWPTGVAATSVRFDFTDPTTWRHTFEGVETMFCMRPGHARHASTTLGMPWPMVAVTSAIFTTARLGLAAGVTDDVATVTGRTPVDLPAWVGENTEAWQRA